MPWPLADEVGDYPGIVGGRYRPAERELLSRVTPQDEKETVPFAPLPKLEPSCGAGSSRGSKWREAAAALTAALEAAAELEPPAEVVVFRDGQDDDAVTGSWTLHSLDGGSPSPRGSPVPISEDSTPADRAEDTDRGWPPEVSSGSDDDNVPPWPPPRMTALASPRPAAAEVQARSEAGAAWQPPGSALACLAGTALAAQTLPTLLQAAEARHRRRQVAIGRDAIAFPPEGSELCRQGRRCVWQWATGRISGRQCMLRLETCPSVVEALRHDKQLEGLPEQSLMEQATLFAFGCTSLGGTDPRLTAMQRSIESAEPAELFKRICQAVGRECGSDDSDAPPRDLNWDWAFTRLTFKAKNSDAASTLELQLWRELARLHLGGVPETDLAEDEEFEGQSGSALLDDAALLEWLSLTPEELAAAARRLDALALAAAAERLLAYAAHIMNVGAQLRALLEDWQRFDAWRVLGISRGATRGEVRRAFYRKALLVHPDKGGDKAAFQELQRAYDEIIAELDAKVARGEAGEEPPSSARPTPARRHRTEAQGAASEEAQPEDECPEEEEVESDEALADEEDELFFCQKAILEAAEGIGECATEVLRHCRQAEEVLEEDGLPAPAQVEQVEVALAAAGALLEGGKVVVKLLVKIADLVQGQRHRRECRGLGRRLRDALEGLKLALSACSLAAAKTTRTLEEMKADFESEAVPRCQRAVLATLGALERTAKLLAVAALDAAEVASGRAAAGEGPAAGAPWEPAAAGGAGEGRAAAERGPGSSGEESDDRRSAYSDETSENSSCSGTSRSDSPRCGPLGGRSPDRVGSAARRDEEARQTRTLVEAVRMLHCANPEVLRLQAAARDVVRSRLGDGAEPLAGGQDRAFSLLAEFLDEALLKFHRALRADLVEAFSGGERALEEAIVGAAKDSFRFVLRADPKIAVPFDVRTQVLRVAVSISADAVRGLVQEQLRRSLKDCLLKLVLDAACTDDAPASLPSLASLQGSCESATETLELLLGDAMDRLADGSRGA